MEHAAHYGIVSIFTNQLAYEVAKKVSEEQGYPYPVYFTPLENAIATLSSSFMYSFKSANLLCNSSCIFSPVLLLF